jgi:hypothetical protein
MLRYLLLPLLFLLASDVFSLTWKEPWQEEVIAKSDYFVLGRVLDAKPGSVKIKVLKQFGQLRTEEVIVLEGYHMLDICSQSDSDKVTFFFQMIDSVYLFLKKTDIGYCLPTPTSGYAIVAGGKVLSTFRHSYHQAQLTIPDYELCMSSIWNQCKGLTYDQKKITDYISKNLNIKPAGFNDREIDLFFRQHAALEVIYYCKLDDKWNVIQPFLNCSNSHLVISAIRCLANYSSTQSRSLLLNILGSNNSSAFIKIIAAWSLKKSVVTENRKQIEELVKAADEEEIGFSSNIMDPRVCTTLGSVKGALEELLASLQ